MTEDIENTANNAKEKMETLLAGKEIWQEGSAYKLNEGGTLICKTSWEEDWAEVCCEDDLLDWNGNAAVRSQGKTYSFTQALGMMAEGKNMRPVERPNSRYGIVPQIGFAYYENGKWHEPLFDQEEVEGAWVEAD